MTRKKGKQLVFILKYDKHMKKLFKKINLFKQNKTIASICT